jgi:class 3 adenylate cyclase
MRGRRTSSTGSRRRSQRLAFIAAWSAPPAICFLDITGYTRLTEERGDEAAAELAGTMSRIVQRTSTAHGGRPIKWLGDGVMLHFLLPSNAVRCALDLADCRERVDRLRERIEALEAEERAIAPGGPENLSAAPRPPTSLSGPETFGSCSRAPGRNRRRRSSGCSSRNSA